MSELVMRSFRLDPETLASLDRLAKRLDRSQAWIVRKAVQQMDARESVQELAAKERKKPRKTA